MEAIHKSSGHFDGRGVCPHCDFPSYFTMQAYTTVTLKDVVEIRSIVECQNCREPILLVVTRCDSRSSYRYSAHYPSGKPNEIVSGEIPDGISADFKEALRCQFVNAYRATATMCRRALQSSCQDLGAVGDHLVHQIEDLAKQGKITAALHEMAHTVRLIGSAGAHPDKDGLEDVGLDDASDLIEFSREFYDHVYVMPAKLLKMKERRKPPDAP